MAEEEKEDFSLFVDDEKNQKLRARKNQTVYWIPDSGASGHMCFNRELFSEVSSCSMKNLTMANGAKAKIEGIGKIRCTAQTDTEPVRLSLNNVG